MRYLIKSWKLLSENPLAPPEKIHSLFFTNSPLQIQKCKSTPFCKHWKNFRSTCRKGGGRTLWWPECDCTSLIDKSGSCSNFFKIYCKNITNFQFWVFWTCLATSTKKKLWCLSCRNFDVYLHIKNDLHS